MNMEALNKYFSVDGDNTLRVQYDLTPNSVVFDLGGYQGEWTNKIQERYGCNIHVFEPISFLFQNIKERFKDKKNIKVFNFGLSDKNKDLQITLANDGSSFYIDGSQKIDAKVMSIVDYIEQNSITNVDLIKINIEGDEYPVLEVLIEQGLINIFSNIQVQFHQNIPDSVIRRNNIRSKLSETHHLTYDYDFVWENWKKNAI